jgi:glycerol uptake facilitator-like aquaporin
MKNKIFVGEFIGSCFLVMIIVGSGLMAENLSNDVAVMLIAQLIGCLIGVGLANFFFEHDIYELSTKSRDGIYIFTSEVIATLGLIIIIFGSMKSGKIAVAASVGLYITAGYWFTSSTSFANPAVAIARTFTESFTGISYLNTPYYILAELVGMLIAVFIVKKLFLVKN